MSKRRFRSQSGVGDEPGFTPPRQTRLANAFLWLGRAMVGLLLIVPPWYYGSVSQLAQTWMMALALGGLICWWFAMAFGNRTRHVFPYLAFPVMLGLILVGCQLVPLSEPLAAVIAPHQAELYAQYATPVDGELLSEAATTTTFPARITMDVDATSKQFNLLTLALICLLLGCHFFSSRRMVSLLPFLLTVNGVAISFFGMVQKIQSRNSIFGIELSEGGVPFGPFVNRNNAAGYLLICLAGALALAYGVFNRRPTSGSRPRQIITHEYPIFRRMWMHIGLFFAELNATKLAAMLAALVIVAGIMATASRGAVIALGIGMVAVVWHYCLTHRSAGILAAAVVSLGLASMLIAWMGLGEPIINRMDQLSDVNFVTTDKRMNHWTQTAPAIAHFAPLGSGVGSYLGVHRLYRTDSEERVYYFAENQFFQTLVEAGILGLLLLIGAIVLLILSVRFIALRGNSPKTTALTIFGVFLIPSQIFAGLVDFGLFIPANTVLMATACGFLAGQAHSLAQRLKKKYIFRFNLPRSFNMVMLLALFAVALFSLLAIYRYALVERAMQENPLRDTYESRTLVETESDIELLSTCLQNRPDAAGFRRLAELYIFKYRISLFHDLLDDRPVDSVDPSILEATWQTTSLGRLHALVYQARRSGEALRLQRLMTDPLVEQNLLPATMNLKQSRQRAPLQPGVHLLLGQLHAVAPQPDADLAHLNRSLELAPANAMTHLIAGILNLQAGRDAEAAENLHDCLQIDPEHYARVIRAAIPFLPRQTIVSEILPVDPVILYDFAKEYLGSTSLESLQSDVFRRVLDLLDSGPHWDRRSLQIKTDVQVRLGDFSGAIETLRFAINSYPDTLSLRNRLANLLVETGDLEAALHVARELVRRDTDQREAYRRLKERIQKLVDEHRFADPEK